MKKNINLLALVVTVFAFVLYLTTWQKGFQGYEGETVNAALKLLDGVWDVKRAGISAVFMYVPFILVIRLFGLNYDMWITLVPLFYSALTAGLITYAVWYLTKKKSVAIAVSVLVAVCTSMWPYSNIGMEYQAGFYLTLLFVLLLRWKYMGGGLIAPSLAFALLATAKSYGPVFGLPVILFVATSYGSKLFSKKCVRDVIVSVLPAIISYIFFTVLKYLFSGSVTGWYSIAYEFKIWTWWEGFYGVFFSIGRGVFFFTPLLVVTLFYWRKFFDKHKESFVFLITSFVLLFLITAPFSYWTDDTWAVRKFVPLIGLMHLPLIYLFEKKWSWKAVRSYLVLFLIACSLYVQFLGASYYYGTQLDVLRQGDLDSLSRMRFTPQLSPIPLYHQLFAGYLNGEDRELQYVERSWFRWTAGMDDKNLHETNIQLAEFQRPDIIWLNRGEVSLKVFYVLLGADIVLVLFIGSQYFYLRKKKD